MINKQKIINNESIKNKMYVVLLLALFFLANIQNAVVATSGILISGPTIVVEGQDIVFTIKYDSNVSYINVSEGDIVLNGFAASSKTVSGAGLTRTVKLTNVRKTNSDYGSITVASGTGYLDSVTKLSSCTSNTFKIKTQQQITEATTRPKEEISNTQNNNSNTNNVPTTQNPNSTTSESIEEPKKEEVVEENPNEEVNENNTNEEITNELPQNYDEIISNPNTGKEM